MVLAAGLGLPEASVRRRAVPAVCGVSAVRGLPAVRAVPTVRAVPDVLEVCGA